MSRAGTHRVIVRWVSATAAKSSLGGERVRKASQLSGMALLHEQNISDDIEVLQSADELSGEALTQILQRLEADPAIEYAAPDLRRQRHAVTSDPLLLEQWYLLSSQPSATRIDAAWDLTQSSAATVVAVVDSGVRFDHPDIGSVDSGGKLLPGYDFISNVAVANDGNGRDPDATDPGDWLTAGELSQPAFKECEQSDSSWHGTRVAGLIGALTGNATGVAGAAWNARVLPVRVLGKCGGYDSDIIAGMRWAAGLSVAGVPLNTTPATIINLSLGGDGLCTAAYQAAVDEITAQGVLIVASAGNDGGPVATPANCSGVLGVSGLRHAGTKVGFSNLGPEVGISAPGGNCVNSAPGQPCLFSIVVATNSGTTTPAAATYSDQINYNIGTSFSSPMAAASAALMRSVNAGLSPVQLISLMKSSATAFPTGSGVPVCHVPTSENDLQSSECTCTHDTCGAGMLNADAAVTAAIKPLVVLSISGSVIAGSSIVADASGSFASNGRSITTYEWSVTDVVGSAPIVLAPAQAQTSIQITGNTAFTLRLTITDDMGAASTEATALSTPAVVVAAPVASTASASAVKKSGGGGQLGWELLIGALALFARQAGHQETAVYRR